MFKYAIRFLKNHECQLRQDSLAKKLSQSRPDDFWKEIRQVNNCNIPLPNSIEDVTGIDGINELWRSHFKQLFNCIRDIDIQQIKCDAKYTNNIVVEISEIENAIKCLDIYIRLVVWMVYMLITGFFRRGGQTNCWKCWCYKWWQASWYTLTIPF